MENKYKKAKRILRSNPRNCFECLLIHFKDERSLDDELWDLFFLSVVKQKDISFESIFDQNLEKRDKRFIASCFLRLIGVNKYLVLTGDNREHKIFKLLDQAIPDIYRNPGIRISPSNNNSEKVQKIGEPITEIENELKSIKNNFHDILSLKDFNHRFIRILNGKVAKPIFSYFIGKEIQNEIKGILDKIINEYDSAEGRSKVQSYQDSLNNIKIFIDKITEEDNPYWNMLVLSPLKNIKNILIKDFEASPLSQPAKLKIIPFDKKYPFSTKGTTCKISLNIINEALGSAFNVRLKVRGSSQGIEILTPNQTITEIGEEEIKVKIEIKIINDVKDALLDVELEWDNADFSSDLYEDLITLTAQRTDIDWDTLVDEDPYSQEPVETEFELIGRDEVIKKLFSGMRKTKISSYFLYGQRRVGKTSIVKTLRSKVFNEKLPNTLVIYIESGDFKHPKPEQTLANLGEKICKIIQNYDRKFQNIDIPKFNGAFSPITTYFDIVHTINPDFKILIILDEFDEISSDLYTRTEMADSFFLTIRSISNRSQLGFILVGGEQMQLVINCQGEKLNKFRAIRVDYFDRKKEWPDFQDLVTKPIAEYGLTIAKGVVDRIFEYTEGNPYYTKMICENLFNEIVGKRDSYITTEEVDEAISNTIENSKENSFMHFWEDGILEDSEKKEQISIARRQVLLAFAKAKNKFKHQITIEHIVDEALKKMSNEMEVRDHLKEFEQRQILINSSTNIRLKIPLFEEWLKSKGISSMITDFADPEKRRKQLLHEESLSVKSKEIIELENLWNRKTYRGEIISSDKIRVWLDQFSLIEEQRIAFTILQKLTFYDDLVLRTKLKEIYNQGARKLEWRIQGNKRKKNHILVSFLDKSIAKSGSEYAKLFVDENNIYYENVVSPDKVNKIVRERDDIQALYFIDDIIGSGRSLCSNLDDLISNTDLINLLEEKDIPIYIGIVCGFEKAKNKVERKIKQLKLNAKIHVCDLLSEKDQCFSEESRIFAHNKQMEARSVCYKYGSNLEKHHPLGYSDCQILVVFPKTCPNNTLPILWKKKENWIPLFERPGASK